MNNKTVNIILAEDDADDRILFQYALEEAATSVNLSTVKDGESLLNVLYGTHETPFDYIFLDINMPGKNGKECLKQIRNDRKFDKVPVVMLTTSSNQKDIEETYSKGASLYITKPCYHSELISILKKVFSLNWKDQATHKKENFVLSAH